LTPLPRLPSTKRTPACGVCGCGKATAKLRRCLIGRGNVRPHPGWCRRDCPRILRTLTVIAVRTVMITLAAVTIVVAAFSVALTG
jgi:hypothetical protein